MAKYKPMPPFEEVDRLLRYEPETGKIYWKIKPCKYIIAGAEAGTISKDRNNTYRKIAVNKARYQSHRIAWFLYYKEDPGEKQIDHKNNNGLDNRISNLRAATNTQNQYNTGINKANTTGYKGVVKNKLHSHRHNPYFARAWLNGKRFHLGSFRTPEEASEAYQRFCKEHHGEFYKE
tara:strand:+ start:1088 stop:1618 length:531 start_codon:yes stop_codon:yes gene_type:complete